MQTVNGPFTIKRGEPLPAKVAKAVEAVFKTKPARKPKSSAVKLAHIDASGSVGRNVYTSYGVRRWNKKEQTKVIKLLQGKEAKVPIFEAGRVALLLKLQNEGADLFKAEKETKE